MTTILMYHKIADLPEAQDPKRLAVSPREFARQLEFLVENGYRCVPLDRAIEDLSGTRPPIAKQVAITFDDGFRDFYTTAAPLLQRYDIPATVFMVTGCAGAMSAWRGRSGSGAASIMSWSEVREMAAAGFEFGSHTVSHPNLATLSSNRVRIEVADSKKKLEDELGRQIDLISYPYGSSDNRVQGIASERGYKAGLGTDGGRRTAMNVWRVQCDGRDSLSSLSRKVRGWNARYIAFREESFAATWLRSSYLFVKRVITSGKP